jgi:hypothetical protein
LVRTSFEEEALSDDDDNEKWSVHGFRTMHKAAREARAVLEPFSRIPWK